MSTYSELGGLSVVEYRERWLSRKVPSDRLLSEYRRLRALPRLYPVTVLSQPLYEAWDRAATKEGRNPSTLEQFEPDEQKRFYGKVIQGPDGHKFWIGGHFFRKNDDCVMRPAKWVWAEAHGGIEKWQSVEPTCGEKGCVAIDHLAINDRGATARRLYSDNAIIGALQTRAMQLGRTPYKREWMTAGWHPNPHTIEKRFGSWSEACKAAGLVPHTSRYKSMDAKLCRSALMAMCGHLRRPPTTRDWELERKWLLREGFPTTAHTVRTAMGYASWGEMLAREVGQ